MLQHKHDWANSSKEQKLEDAFPRPSTFQINEQVYQFDWNNKWLNGEEYHYILRNSEKYISYYQFERCEMKVHPLSIYQAPISEDK